jgi:hypothetical protein
MTCVDERRHPHRVAPIARSRLLNGLHPRATAGGSCGVRRSAVVLVVQLRLQKSTDGGWLITSFGEELEETVESSPSMREHRRGESASEAGSSAAKPRDRWRAHPRAWRESAAGGASVEERRSGSGKLSHVDDAGGQNDLGCSNRPHSRCGRKEERHGASEVDPTAPVMAENATPGSCRRRRR